MVNNNVTNSHATATLHNAGAAAQQHPPLLPRTETQADTLRPVAPAQAQSATDRVSISNQARSLAANAQEESYTRQAADARRQENQAGQTLRGRVSSGADQYRAVLKTVGAS